jgi:Zn-dependent oligopeptidase
VSQTYVFVVFLAQPIHLWPYIQFLDDLHSKLIPVGEKDRSNLLALKKAEHESLGLPFDGEFYLWDYRYYDRLYTEKEYELDDALVKEYFPVSVVVPAILNIYQGLLGVRFEEVKADLWHPEVQQFAVWEKDAKDGEGFIGWCYLDLFPRGKHMPPRVRFGALMNMILFREQVLPCGCVGPDCWT